MPVTEQTTVILDDESEVKLNTNTSLSVPVHFAANSRALTLNHGEAYFNISHDQARPMGVQVEGLHVRVLGTTFNIKAYPNEPLCTTLIEGSVQLKDQSGNDLILEPGYQAIEKNGRLVSWRVDPDDYTSWINGDFVFNRMPLAQIMAHLERKYDIKAQFSADSLKKMTYTGVFKKDFSKDYIFSLLEKTTNLKIIHTDSGHTVTISTR